VPFFLVHPPEVRNQNKQKPNHYWGRGTLRKAYDVDICCIFEFSTPSYGIEHEDRRAPMNNYALVLFIVTC